MGIFDQGFLGQLFGGGSNDASRASKAEIAAQERAIEELSRQFNLSREDLAVISQKFQPFVDAGVGQLGALTEGASVEGLDARLGRIQNSDVFGNLVDIRSRGVRPMAFRARASSDTDTCFGTTLSGRRSSVTVTSVRCILSVVPFLANGLG